MGRKYYYLVSGLVELTLESDHKGFDAAALRDDIAGELGSRDRGYVKTFYTFYDVENVINAIKGKTAFNVLGNLGREDIEDELSNPHRLPESIIEVIRAYRNLYTEDDDEEDRMDTSVPVERALWEAFYGECAKSDCSFIREWFDFDRTLRNIVSAYTARANSLPIADQLVGRDEVTETLSRSSAADFGLRSEVEYVEQIIGLLDVKNIIEKENCIDRIRWDKADDLTTFDYFDINEILAYLVKVNIIHRWVALNPTRGREMFRELIDGLIDREKIRRTEDEALERFGS